MITHYLHERAQKPRFNGLTALCDYKARPKLADPPRTATLASAVRNEVDCRDCLLLMEQE